VVTIWVWKNLDRVTNNYHDSGGVVVSADFWSDAIKLLREATPEFFNLADEELTSPDHVFSPGINTGPDKVIIFPNAGCC
jgi:hypothetical protein